MKLIIPLLFLFSNLSAQTESSFKVSSGLSFSDHPDLFQEIGLSFKDLSSKSYFRIEFSVKYFDLRLAVENKFGIEYKRFYGFAYFDLIQKTKKDREKMIDVSNSVGMGLLYRIPVIDGNIIELGVLQSLFEYRGNSRLTFFNISVLHKL